MTSQSTGRGVAEGEAAAPRPGKRPTARFASFLASDIDDVVVQRLLSGQPPEHYTSWERREAVRQLRVWGYTHMQIAERLGIAVRQVLRDLERFSLVDVGSMRQARQAAMPRREVVARLYAEGLRRCEMVRLLGVSEGAIKRDLASLGLPGTGYHGRAAGRPRDELLALYGHLLPDPQRPGLFGETEKSA